MKISINWLKNYVNIPTDTDFNAFGELFTTRTAEIEEIIDLKHSYDKMVIGQIKEIEKHPDADKLQVTKTDVGGEILQIVCGASNIFVGQKVAVALIGAKVRWHGEGDLVEMKPTKIRGVESAGMICAASEIGLKDELDGIMDLSHLEVTPGTSLAEALQKDDIIVDIDNKSLTHRPDLWGHYGIAREIAAITDEKLKPLTFQTEYASGNPIIPVEVDAPELCPRYLSTTIENIKVEPSPDWLRSALENTGNRSINNIVDATNFVMLELGNPLHAFDTTTIKEKLLIRKAKKDEKIETLKEGEKTLSEEMLVIADAEKPLAIAGVMGGLNSGITEETDSITLESANFNPVSVRKTSTALGIRTESVQRFEKDLDPLLAEQALDRLTKIILDLCPDAKIVAPKVDVNNFTYKPRTVKIDLDKVRSKIGVEIDENEIRKNLESLEFKVDKDWNIEIPSFRATKDVNHQDDLIEEIARLHGYEKIPARLPELTVQLPEINSERAEKSDIRNILSLELGMNEAMNYSFYSQKNLQDTGLNEDNHLKLKNYLSEEQTHLRTTLLPNLLKSAAENLKHSESCRLYEIGRTYQYINEFFPLEEKYVAGLIVLPKKTKSNAFYEARDAASNLLNRLGITSLKYQKAEKELPYAHPNKHAAHKDYKSNLEIAHIFELHPLTSKKFDLDKFQVAAFEVNYTKLHQLPRKERVYKQIPRFPGIEIDISVLMDKDLAYDRAHQAIKQADQNLIRQIQLFDLYQGDNIPADKKSMAFKVTLQSPDRTLTDEDMKTVQNKIFENLSNIGGEIRGL